MTRACTSCGDLFEARGSWQRLCWDCWRKKRDEEHQQQAFDRGFQAGLRRGRMERSATYPRKSDATVQRSPDDAVLRDAIALCHPDRHPPERAEQANRVTAVLLALRNGHKAEGR